MLFQPKNVMLFEESADKGEGGTVTPPEQNSGKRQIVFESEEAYQADMEAKLKARLEREKDKAEKLAAKARADAEADAAKKNGEWQKLAEQREAELSDLQKRIAELEIFPAKAERYEGTLKKFLAAQKKDLPGHILSLLEKLDPVDQLEYLTANADALHKVETPAEARPLGTPPGKRPTGGNKQVQDLPVQRVSY